MIPFLRGTQAALNSSQQIFPEGQPIYEKDTHQLKIGDGVNNYSGLPYIGGTSSSSYEVHLDPSNPHWNGYVDLNGSIRLVFGRTTAHLLNVSGTMKSQSVLSADGETFLGFPASTSSLYTDHILSLYGMKSNYMLLNICGMAGSTQCMFFGGTYFEDDGTTNSLIPLGYFGRRPADSADQECYAIFLTWD